VLLVEDSPTQAEQLTWLLQEEDFTVTTVGDAEQGLQQLEQEAFDLVLTDLMLPGLSGFDLCRQIKAQPRWRDLAVVVLTSQADPINVLRGLEAGADGFMTKDREPGEIIGRLRRALNRPPRSGEAARVVFLDCQFQISADREQLLNVLLAAFEDMVHLNQQYHGTLHQLRTLNTQLQETVHSEQQALARLKQAQSQLVQAEKLSSLGQMVAGIVHEINNPLALVSNNVFVLQRDAQALHDLVALYREGDATLAAHLPELGQRIGAYSAEIDLPYTLANLAGLLARSSEGLRRIQQIIKGLREFARLDTSGWKEVNMNDGIAFILDLFQSRAAQQGVKMQADLGRLPTILCQPANLNQVLFNLVANALEACPTGEQVTVRTRPVQDGLEIQVVDSGRGIDPAIRERIFDPFFTTKPPGKGPGLGLSISHSIVQDHGGRITFTSAPGRGSSFTVFLPQKAPARSRDQESSGGPSQEEPGGRNQAAKGQRAVIPDVAP
jgi:two-component system, NtrC family, sensor kinase